MQATRENEAYSTPAPSDTELVFFYCSLTTIPEGEAIDRRSYVSISWRWSIAGSTGGGSSRMACDRYDVTITTPIDVTLVDLIATLH